MIRSSKKLDKWFKANEKHPDFCQFMYGQGLFDESYIEDKPYGSEAVRMGYDLAIKAGTRPVYQCDIVSGTLWFIGEEEEILARLEGEWGDYLANDTGN